MLFLIFYSTSKGVKINLLTFTRSLFPEGTKISLRSPHMFMLFYIIHTLSNILFSGTSPGHPGSQQQSSSSYYFDSFPSAPSRGLVGPGDSLLEGLGILSPSQAGVSSVKTEMVSCPSPQQQYNMTVDSRGQNLILYLKIDPKPFSAKTTTRHKSFSM